MFPSAGKLVVSWRCWSEKMKGLERVSKMVSEVDLRVIQKAKGEVVWWNSRSGLGELEAGGLGKVEEGI